MFSFYISNFHFVSWIFQLGMKLQNEFSRLTKIFFLFVWITLEILEILLGQIPVWLQDDLHFGRELKNSSKVIRTVNELARI